VMPLEKGVELREHFSAGNLLEESDILRLMDRVRDFHRVLGQFCNNGEHGHDKAYPWLTVEITRYAVDPLIAEAVPDMYDVSDESKRCDLKVVTEGAPYVTVTRAALEQIAKTWPSAFEDLQRFVKMIIHVPSDGFRSCSSPDIQGVIVVTDKVKTVLELEECIVHEGGHQILFCVDQLYRLVAERPPGQLFRLPWSGAQRTIYAYFHALYIYVRVALYLERVRERPRAEQEQVTVRLRDILLGLLQAVPELGESDCLTPEGRALFEVLRSEVFGLRERHRVLL